MENTKSKEKKSHIYEIDFLRAFTVFSVVTVHTFAELAYLYQYSNTGTDILATVIHTLHFNREIFIFITGLVLTYVYFNKSFSKKKFYLKRFLFIFIPYILWSLIYIQLTYHTFTPNHSYATLWTDLLTGNASYQLYYILLTLQYYAIFPLFLWFIKKVKKHPIPVLLISFIVQIVLIYYDFYYLQIGPLSKAPFVVNFILPYHDRFFLTYQFFFIFGSFTAIYLDKIYTWFKKYGHILPIVFIIILVFYVYYFIHELNIKYSMTYALSVLQPSVVIYSIITILFLFWLSILWNKKKPAFKFIKSVSDTSFGIFFVHIMIINQVIKPFLPQIPPTVPIWETLIFSDIVTFILSLIMCIILMRIPFLSWTIGIGKNSKRV